MSGDRLASVSGIPRSAARLSAVASSRRMRPATASLVSCVANSSGMPWVNPVANRLGAIHSTRMPTEPRSRAIVRHIPAIPAFAAV